MKRTLNTTTREQLTGLSDALRSRTISVNADGVATTNVVSYDPETMVETSTTSSPAFGTRVARGVCGLVLEEETADETIAHIYDPHGREERTDRRASGEADFRTVAEFVYNAMGDMVERRTYTNATDYVTERFAYDHEGREIASTNALGNVVTTSYDPRGNVTAVDGATYPLRMEYDLQGRRTALTTFRDAGGAASSPPVGDTTRWTLDPATGLCLSKTYADNSTVSYTYTPDGLPARTTWPDGRWSELVYDEERNVAGMTRSDDTPGIFLSCDAYGETTNAMDTVGNAWRYVYGENSALLCETNVLAGGRLSSAAGQGNLFIPSICVMSRALDAQGRPAGYSFAVDGVAKGGIGYAYDDEGRIASIAATNSAGRVIVVSYLHGNGHVNGYEIRLPGGGAFGRSVVRDPYRRELVASCSSSFGGSVVDSYAYGYNSYGWPVARNGDSFAYNERGEVARAEIGGDVFTHEYDGIGNHTLWGDNAVTNEYAHNSLNQLTSSQRISVPSVAPCEMTYSSNGGLASDGTWLYAYDAEDRLVSVTSASLTNGALRVENAYDWRDRRISKTVSRYDSTDETWNVVERRVFTYDDWNLVHETIMQISGVTPITTEIQYFWGFDLSETLQGAGGVGGLLAVSINDSFYFPCYDNNGNVTKYVDETGAVAASYAYDDFGRVVSQSGPLADAFPHRFSTKYFDADTGLFYYGYRFYSPLLKRWLNRDPIGEEGGANLLMSCKNSFITSYDLYGCFVIEYYSLRSSSDNKGVVYKSLATIDDVAVRAEIIKPSIPHLSLTLPSSAHGVFHQELTDIDDCSVRIRVEINLNAELGSTIRKGDLYVYWPHYENGAFGGGETSIEAKSGRRPPRGNVLAHERGHAEVFLTLTKTRFENDISSYLSKETLTVEEQKEVKALFIKAQRDSLGESGKRANVNTVLWFHANDFSVTRRREGKLNSKSGDPYEFIKR